MRNIKIGVRLALGFGLLIALVVIMSGIGGGVMLEGDADNATIAHQQTVALETADLHGLVSTNVADTLAQASLVDKALHTDPARAMAQSTAEVQKLIPRIAAGLHRSQEKALLQDALTARSDFLRGRSTAFEEESSGNAPAARTFFQTTMPTLVDQYEGKLHQLDELERATARGAIQSSDEDNKTGMVTLGLATLLALLGGPLFAWRVTRSITHPLASTVGLANAIADRDLSRDIHPQGKDEVTALERALRQMVQNLRDTIEQVHEGAGAIAAASGQISTGNTDLASRTEEQSSALAETASAMEEITSTVRQNADHADEANALANGTAQAATDSAQAVAHLIDLIHDIHAKSTKVAEIVGLIDSIAFQTNILALNAAVEAARAGQQGRGFAVVASEVRSLAQRSSDSSHQIKALIDATVAVVASGDEHANLVGTAMGKVATKIDQVNKIMHEISLASREQTIGIEEINKAITQMDEVTRQNASLVEESATAAGSLQSQATTLDALIATFNLGATSGIDGRSATVTTVAARRTESDRPSAPARTAPTGRRAPKRPTAGDDHASTDAEPALADTWTEF